MTTVIGGSSPSITFSDSTTQSTAALPLTGGQLSGNLTFASGTNGIIFNNSSATTNSTLNDYETGTFTPALAYYVPGTSSFTYTTQSGTYVKIGRLVFIWAFVQVNSFSKGTASGNFLITGLPFTSGVNNDQTLSWNTFNSPLTTTAGQFPLAVINGNQSTVQFQTAANGSTANAAWPDVTNNSQYKVSGTYYTTF